MHNSSTCSVLLQLYSCDAQVNVFAVHSHLQFWSVHCKSEDFLFNLFRLCGSVHFKSEDFLFNLFRLCGSVHFFLCSELTTICVCVPLMWCKHVVISQVHCNHVHISHTFTLMYMFVHLFSHSKSSKSNSNNQHSHLRNS